MDLYEFKLYTIIDITNTGDRSDDCTRNFLTTINGLGLHFQPIYDTDPLMIGNYVDNVAFGSHYVTSSNIWMFRFFAEGDTVVNVELAKRGLNGTPIIMPHISCIVTDENDEKCNMRIQQIMEL